MPDFQRVAVNDQTFIRGAARLLWAGSTVAFPSLIGNVVNMTTYDPMTGWNELGATKNGIQISFNNSEETFDVDQIYGNIKSQPTNWECSVQTQLAEHTTDRLAIAWEGGDVTTVATPYGAGTSEKWVGIGAPENYTERKLAVVFKRADGKLRAYIFRKTYKAAAESTFTHAKTGEQATIPVRWSAYADLSTSDARTRFFQVNDQL